MQQTGTVVAQKGNMVLVRFVRSKACAHCGACLSLSDGLAETEIPNTLGAKPGDVVEIELHAKSFIKASFLAYIVPLLALLAGVFIGSTISDLAAVLMGLGGAAAVYVVLRLLEPHFARMSALKPRMIRICTQDEQL